MLRSPPNLRPRGKPAVTDKPKVRSLSSDSDPSSTGVMVLSKEDASLIEACVNKHISGGDVLDTIVNKITQKLSVVIEEAVSAAVKAAFKEIEGLRTEVATLTTHVAELEEKLLVRSDDLEQYQRRNNLRVFGIEERDGEDTDRLVLQTLREKLNIDLPISSIERSHRIGRLSQESGPDKKKRSRPIIVRFSSYRDRHQVFENKKLLKNTGLVIREDLTAYRLRVLNAAAEKHGFRNTWTVDGRVKWVVGDGKNKKVYTAVRLSEVK